jgi:hypothetical protein
MRRISPPGQARETGAPASCGRGPAASRAAALLTLAPNCKSMRSDLTFFEVAREDASLLTEIEQLAGPDRISRHRPQRPDDPGDATPRRLLRPLPQPENVLPRVPRPLRQMHRLDLVLAQVGLEPGDGSQLLDVKKLPIRIAQHIDAVLARRQTDILSAPPQVAYLGARRQAALHASTLPGQASAAANPGTSRPTHPACADTKSSSSRATTASTDFPSRNAARSTAVIS